MSRKEDNRGALEDWLDGTLPALHPGSLDPDAMPDDNAKTSRILLYERLVRRVDGENMPGEEESHRLLMDIMVNPRGELARRDPAAHSALVQHVYTAPAGYTSLLALEKAAPDDVAAREAAEACRAGFELTLDILEERGHKLVVKYVPTPKWRDFQRTASAHQELIKRYDRHFSSAYAYLKDEKRARAKAIDRTHYDTGYTKQNIRRVIRSQNDVCKAT